ncbi:4786_t:CDS:2 [Funneliformis mosseae]|uniref:4786_t:CDS:1 n=1 Tax=Funneliformis mosseae TaxID=27381 RepID=A0A9N9AAY5_FUNMO|nr:4786_t:CDS:2 [Funneliformis mosseae]
MHQQQSAIIKDICLSLFKVFLKVPEIKANIEDNIADIYDDLKDDVILKNYNDTVKEEILDEPDSESEDARLFK